MGAGRPVGAKNKLPTHGKIYDALIEHDFDWIKEFVALYHESHSDVKLNALLGVAPFLFPKRKPEDATGDASQSPLLGIQVTDAQLITLVKTVRGET